MTHTPHPAPGADADALQRVLDAILTTAPKERPLHWSEIDDAHYDAYQQGKAYMLYDIADMLRKAIENQPPTPASEEA